MPLSADQRHGQASETSPLLPKDDSALTQASTVAAGPATGAPADGQLPAPTTTTDGAAEAQEDEDGGEMRRTDTADNRAKQYQGLPEVQARMKYIFPAMAIGVFLSAADQTLIVSSYGVIGTDLHALEKTSWIATAYFLTITCFQPLYGKLSDIFSRKSCLLFGYVVFSTGCFFCGMARNIYELIAARAFAGIGGGGMTTLVSIILSDAIPLQERGLWQGYINIVYAFGASAGSVLGGLLADSVGWRLSFLLQVPMCLVAFIAVYFLLHLPSPDAAGWKERFRRIDFLGAIVLILATLSLLVGLDTGSNYAWADPWCFVPLCISAPLFGLLILVETKVAIAPFAPGSVIFERSAFASFMCSFFSFAGWLAGIYYIALYYQAVEGHGASKAGLLALPQIFCGVSGSVTGGFYMRRTGKYYWGLVVPYGMLCLGLVAVLLSAHFRQIVGVVLGSCVCGFANGFGITTCLIALIANVKRDDQAVATACSYLFRSLGSTVGVSLSAASANQVLRISLKHALGSGTAADKIEHAVRNSLGAIRKLDPQVQSIVRDSYADATQAAFALQVGFLACCALSAWFVRERPLQ